MRSSDTRLTLPRGETDHGSASRWSADGVAPAVTNRETRARCGRQVLAVKTAAVELQGVQADLVADLSILTGQHRTA